MRADEISIPTPCDEDWDAMDREERGRYCHRCAHSVHDLSSMTEPEAQALLEARADQDLCISVVLRGESIAHRDDPIPPRALLRRTSAVLSRFAPSALAGALAVAGAAGCTPHSGPEVLEIEEAAATGSGFSTQVVIPDDDRPTRTVGETPCDPATRAPSIKHKWPAKKGKLKRVTGTKKSSSGHDDFDTLVVGSGT